MFIAQVLVGPRKQLKEIIQIEHKLLRIPTGGRQTSWLFTGATEKLNSGLPRTTSASGTILDYNYKLHYIKKLLSLNAVTHRALLTDMSMRKSFHLIRHEPHVKSAWKL